MFQIVVTAVVIASAAGVALLCDLLKNKNEQLREQMLEMRLRHEQEARRTAMRQRVRRLAGGPRGFCR